MSPPVSLLFSQASIQVDALALWFGLRGQRFSRFPGKHGRIHDGGPFLEAIRPPSCRYGKEAGELERMDDLEFIARVVSHIPDKGQVTVRYYGLCKALHNPYYAEFKIMLS